MDDPRMAGSRSSGYPEDHEHPAEYPRTQGRSALGNPSDTVDHGHDEYGQGHSQYGESQYGERQYGESQYGQGQYGQGQYGHEPAGPAYPTQTQYRPAEGRTQQPYGRSGAQSQQQGGDEGGGIRRHLGLGGALAVLSGLLSFFAGVTGILRGLFYNHVANYPFNYSVRGRSTTELIIGAVLFMLGVCLLMGMHFARRLTIIVAILSAIFSFMFLPFYPFWSFVLIALDIFIIWELAREHRRQAS